LPLDWFNEIHQASEVRKCCTRRAQRTPEATLICSATGCASRALQIEHVGLIVIDIQQALDLDKSGSWGLR